MQSQNPPVVVIGSNGQVTYVNAQQAYSQLGRPLQADNGQTSYTGAQQFYPSINQEPQPGAMSYGAPPPPFPVQPAQTGNQQPQQVAAQVKQVREKKKKNLKPECWCVSLVVSDLLALASLAMFSYFLNHPQEKYDCWASAYGEHDDYYAYHADIWCPYRDDCVNVTQNYRSVCGWGIFFALWWLLIANLPLCFKPCVRNNHCCNFFAYLMSLFFLVSLTIYRFRWAGRVCAGDYIDETDIEDHFYEESMFMKEESTFFYWWVICAWSLVPVLLCWHCFINRKDIPNYKDLDMTIFDDDL